MQNVNSILLFSFIITATLSQQQEVNFQKMRNLLQEQYLGIWQCQSAPEVCLNQLESLKGQAIVQFNDQNLQILLQYNRYPFGQKLNQGKIIISEKISNMNLFDKISYHDHNIQNITSLIEFKDNIIDIQHMKIMLTTKDQEHPVTFTITFEGENSATPYVIFSCIFIFLILVSCISILVMLFLGNLHLNFEKISLSAYLFALFSNQSMNFYYSQAIEMKVWLKYNQVGWYSITLIIIELLQIGFIYGFIFFVLKTRFPQFNFCYCLLLSTAVVLSHAFIEGYLYTTKFLILYQFFFCLPLLCQIVHNVRKKTNGFFKFYYLFPLVFPSINILYFRGCPQNVIEMEYNYIFCGGFFLINIFFLIILYLQHRFGSQFYKNEIIHPKGYQYFKKVQINDLEECCPICLSSLINDPEDQEQNNIQTQLLKTLMIPPCNHKFHISCMLSWIEVQKQCPVCRAPLLINI